MASYGLFSSLPHSLFLFAFFTVLLNHLQRFGRENFQESIKMSNRANPQSINWSQFKYMVFDVPTHSGTYQERYSLLGNYSLQLTQHNNVCMLAYI